MSLDNILITGSSNGLGSHLALFYAKKGHHIILHGRNGGKLKEISESIKKSGFSAVLQKPFDMQSLSKSLAAILTD